MVEKHRGRNPGGLRPRCLSAGCYWTFRATEPVELIAPEVPVTVME